MASRSLNVLKKSEKGLLIFSRQPLFLGKIFFRAGIAVLSGFTLPLFSFMS